MALSEAERIRLILAVREKEDPCRQMVLTPSQRMADESRARYIGIRGGNRTGKSSLSAKKLATVARRLPDCKTTSVSGVYIVFCPSRSQISDPWGKKLLKASEVKGELFDKPFIPAYEIKNIRYTYGAGEPTVNLIELKNGNQILFCVSGDKNVWKRIEGKGMILGIVFDESAGTEQLLEEAMTRLLDANSSPIVKAEAGGAWVMWGATQTKKSPAFERFLALGQSGANPDYAAFDLLPGENPAIDQAEREKMAAIMSKDSYEIRMLGHGSAAGAMALYPQWDDERNLAPLGQDYVPTADDSLWVAYDPGTHYTGILVCAINRSRPRCLRAVQVWQPQRTTIEYDLKLLREWLCGRALEGFVYDQAARKMEKVGMSVIGKIQNIVNTKGTDIRIHRGLLMGRSEYASTVPIVRRYLCLPPGDPDGDTNLILNRGDGCDLLRWQLQNCAFTEKGYELKESQIVAGQDHISDCARYLCSRLPSWVDRGLNPKLWGPGTNGSDPDASRINHGDTTAADHTVAVAPVLSESPASRQRQSEAAKREKRIRATRAVW